MRGNRRAILVDIHEKKLDPKKSYTAVDKSGHLSDVKTLGSKQQPVFASSGFVSSDVKHQKKQEQPKIETKPEVIPDVIENVLELETISKTNKEEIQLSRSDELVETITSESQELKIEKNQKKKKKSLNQD